MWSEADCAVIQEPFPEAQGKADTHTWLPGRESLGPRELIPGTQDGEGADGQRALSGNQAWESSTEA